MAEFSLQQTFQTALRHHRAGQLVQAESFYRQILTQQPDHPDALHLLGVIAHQVGRNDVAVDLIGRAIALKPDDPNIHYDLGKVRKAMGELDQAVAAYRRAIVLKPDFSPARGNLGNALKDLGRLDEALAAYREAIAIDPDSPEMHFNLGVALQADTRFDEAIAAYRRAIALRSEHPEAHANLGTTLQAIGQMGPAIAAYRRAIALRPDFAEAHSHLSFALLSRGDFAQGWDEYEWRLKRADCIPRAKPLGVPQWAGEDLSGRTILLHAEQGLGDTIQFIRYVPWVADRGGKVVLECPPALHRLFGSVPGIGRLVATGQPLPACDLHCPLMSLPRAFGTRLETIPGSVPYLNSDPQLADAWRRRLSDAGNDLKVGLAWAGTSVHANDAARSMKLIQLAPLGDVHDVRFYSLQKGPAAAQSQAPVGALDLIDFSDDLTDFAETAALIANLDLVISVDTAVAHLAGAMGKPVWVLLPYAPDWRWLLDREDSPWYPTLRLFRQQAVGRWDDVVERVAECLQHHVRQGRRTSLTFARKSG